MLLADMAQQVLARWYVIAAVHLGDVRFDAFDEFLFGIARDLSTATPTGNDECHRPMVPRSLA